MADAASVINLRTCTTRQPERTRKWNEMTRLHRSLYACPTCLAKSSQAALTSNTSRPVQHYSHNMPCRARPRHCTPAFCLAKSGGAHVQHQTRPSHTTCPRMSTHEHVLRRTNSKAGLCKRPRCSVSGPRPLLGVHPRGFVTLALRFGTSPIVEAEPTVLAEDSFDCRTPQTALTNAARKHQHAGTSTQAPARGTSTQAPARRHQHAGTSTQHQHAGTSTRGTYAGAPTNRCTTRHANAHANQPITATKV
jgi:hypothetical protein